MKIRNLAALFVLALIVAACGAGTSDDADSAPSSTSATPSDEGDTDTPEDGDTGSLPTGPSALDDRNDPSFPEPLVDVAQIISGGPPPDGIPPIDNPQFVTVEEADEILSDDEPVIYLDINGEVHAYPIRILIWHEIVNDTVGDVPVAVTYCPLCNSAVSYERTIRGVETTFGTSGRLFASALVMYDRATESLWTHYDGQAVIGVLTGEQLEPISSPLLAWADFKATFPEAEVLDQNATGYNRAYGSNPYVGYDDPNSTPFLFNGTVDDRAAAMRRIVGVEIDGEAQAWSLDSLAQGEATATNDFIGETPVAILWKAGQSSALDSGELLEGRDVGSVGVFSPVVDGEQLTFEADGDVFVDQQTGSTWDITGRATAGDLEGTELTQIHHLDTFWFAWSTYQPDTDLIG